MSVVLTLSMLTGAADEEKAVRGDWADGVGTDGAGCDGDETGIWVASD